MNEQNPAVLILLASYNGSAYLRPMIESILAQDWGDWRLVLSDDCSRDESPAILAEYAQTYSEKITYYQSGVHFGSAQKHFMHLLSHFKGQAPYLMFCDQDDIWHSDKVRKTLALMKKTETDEKVPALVHTDLRVVNGQLGEIAPSFLKYSRLDGHQTGIEQLLVQNVVTGCTVMVNQTLAELAGDTLPEACLMHDWWLALLASACGHVGFLNEPTIDYRQHGSNTVGAKDAGSISYVSEKLKQNKMKAAFFATFQQAAAFAACYHGRMPDRTEALIRSYGTLFQKGKLARLRGYCRGRFWKQGFSRRVGQIIWG